MVLKKESSQNELDKQESASRIYLQVENLDEDEEQIDLINIAGNMARRKKLYFYVLVVAACFGMLIGLILVGVEYFAGDSSFAQAVISFQYEGIEDGLDPNGAAFDINKLKSPTVIEAALESLGITEYSTEDIRQNIMIEGVIPEDAVERITVIKEMALEDVSNYEKVLDVTYFPSQYIVYLYKDWKMSSSDATEILNAVLESYRSYFFDTYANTEALTVTSNLLNYEDYDYTEAIDLVDSQIEIMQDYVFERREQAPDFRSSSTGLSFGDIYTSLDTIESIDLSNLQSYVESHTLTKDKKKQKEYYEYRIQKYNMEISELQVQLANVQSTIDNYQKDPVVIVSSQESTQQFEQTNEYYDTLLEKKLDLSSQIAELNTSLNKTYILLNDLNASDNESTQAEYDYADEMLASLVATISKWTTLTEETTEEYYTTTLFSNAYKISVPAQYKAAGGLMAIAKKLLICVAACLLVVIVLWCADGLLAELRHTRSNSRQKG